MADIVVMLDGKGSVDARSNTKDMANNEILIEELRRTKAIVTNDDGHQNGSVSSESGTKQSGPKATTEARDPNKLERQRGDLGLYRFYFFSSGIWYYVAWMLMGAINMLWSQMPCMTHAHNPLCSFQC